MRKLSSTTPWQVLMLLLVFAGSGSASAGEVKQTVAKSKHGIYVVVMTQAPAISYEGGMKGYAKTKPEKNQRMDKQADNVRAYASMLQAGHMKAMGAVGVEEKNRLHNYKYAFNGFAAKMSHEQAQELAQRSDVMRVFPDELRQKMTDNSGSYLGLTSPNGAYAQGIDGEGVVIGIIDTGIWPEHPSFADDGTYGETITGLPCEFGDTEHNANDAAFECNNKLIGARQVLPTYRAVVGATADEFNSARDDDGHGTHVASTAGGNANVPASILGRSFGKVTGVAPRARIVAYKALGTLGGFGSDLAAAIDQAVADGVDVINYSVGSSSFALGPDDIAFLSAANAGVFVATSNGNSGPNPATTGSPASVPWLTSVGASTQNRTYQGRAIVNGRIYRGASITPGTETLPLVDAEAAGDALCEPGKLDADMVKDKIVLCARGAFARIAKSRAVHEAGGAGMILFNQNDGQSEVTDTHYVPSVHISNTMGMQIKDYIARAGERATARIQGGEFRRSQAPFMAAFSSRGPNRLSPDLIKPDVTAPGVNILAGATPMPVQPAPQGQMFQSISGTSMSSPHVAGLFALMKQVYPDWTPAMAKSALMTTAHDSTRKEDNKRRADPFDVGAGHVVPGGTRRGSMFEPGLVYDVGLVDYAAYTCGENFGIFSAGLCADLQAAGFSMAASDLNLPSIGAASVPGVKTIRRTVTSVADEKGWVVYDAKISHPKGFRVTVTPKRLHLKKGMSADIVIKIENLAAPVGEWRFGRLMWKSTEGRYRVRSPIAVKASQIDVPGIVSGSGAAGAGDIPVLFGYTGTYQAVADGLVAAMTEDAVVVQDPDQDFDPNDGYSNMHSFEVNNASYLRLALPGGAAEDGSDLDLFLFDPDGNAVASSANGGSIESVEVVAPANGTWTLYVHGYTAPDGDSPYKLHSWILPMDSDDSLSVVNAPGSAKLGESGAVSLEWKDAADGTLHYGILRHMQGDELIGTTLVEIDNR